MWVDYLLYNDRDAISMLSVGMKKDKTISLDIQGAMLAIAWWNRRPGKGRPTSSAFPLDVLHFLFPTTYICRTVVEATAIIHVESHVGRLSNLDYILKPFHHRLVVSVSEWILTREMWVFGLLSGFTFLVDFNLCRLGDGGVV